MIVYYMRGKHGHSCAGATHMTKVFVKRTILFLQCTESYGRTAEDVHVISHVNIELNSDLS